MKQRTISGRGSVPLLAVVVAAALLLLLPALALAATPSVTIVGPEYITMTPPPTAAVPAVDDAWVTLYLQDNGSGADTFRLSNDAGGTWSTGYALTTEACVRGWYMYNGLTDATLTMDGDHTVWAQFSNDGGTTWGATASATTMIDQQPPVVTAPDGYWNSRYPYKLTAHDQIGLSGVQYLWYRVDASALTKVTNTSPLFTADPLTATFALPGETGTPHTIDFVAQDYAGNYSGYYLVASTRASRVTRSIRPIAYAYSVYVVVDKTAPKVKAMGAGKGWHGGPVTVSFNATDGTSGIDRIEYSVTGFKAKKHGYWTVANSVVVTQPGRHKVWYRAIDRAQPIGNASSSKYVVVKIH
jgi:hypothetical protein